MALLFAETRIIEVESRNKETQPAGPLLCVYTLSPVYSLEGKNCLQQLGLE